jgi:hypothetical protein
VSVGSALFTKIATTESEAARLLTKLEELLDSRGHASAAMTLDTYADLFESDLNAVAERVAKMWPDRVISH